MLTIRERYLDVLASVYIYNEYRWYTSLDRVLDAVRARFPDDHAFATDIGKHRADERKHYVMFRRWFERQGRMPLQVDSSCGHIDRFIQWIFGCAIEELDTQRVVVDATEFEQLCRVIMLTEQRGYSQVGNLLRNRFIRSDPIMKKTFQIVHRDEPDHFLPYQRWLERHGKATTKWNERAADWCIHKALMLAKLPGLFLDVGTPRLRHWPDENSSAYLH